jgi:extracellular factor (EF) 3-hydroxypalmitic acid methyl ester biosynthesis protein
METSIVSEVGLLDREFIAGVRQFAEQLQTLEDQIDDSQQPELGDSFHQQVLEAFEQSQRCCREFERRCASDQATLREAQQFFRKEIAPWFSKSWIAQRAHSKPSGFAGDYEMLIKLYDEATPALGLGGYIDLCILDLPLARAVRGRLAAARAFLLEEIESRKRPTRILDIASGPCREYLEWPVTPHPVEVVALDNDKEALRYVEQQMVEQLPASCDLQPARYNALRTRSSEATLRTFGSFDIIYSVGLCDYLADDHLVGLFAGWRETLNENGVLYIAFKDTERYDKTPYQWHLDWFFYQRTMGDVLKLYEQAGFDVDAIHTSRDSTGIIINFLSRETTSKIRRVDGAARGVPRKTKVHPISQPAFHAALGSADDDGDSSPSR